MQRPSVYSAEFRVPVHSHLNPINLIELRLRVLQHLFISEYARVLS
jgi:hypothetical protein